MDTVITFTPEQVYTMLIGICGAIVTVSAATTIIVNVVKKVKSPDAQRDQKIADLQKKIDEHEKRLDAQDGYFKNDKNRLEQIERNSNATNRVIIETLQALVEHARHGNNIAQLDQANQDLNAYLIGGKNYEED